MPELEIGGRTFRDIDSYNLARKDYQNIEKLKETLDMTDISSVKAMLSKIDGGYVTFYSLLGNDFTEELEEVLKALELEKAEADSKKTKKTKKIKKYNGKQNVMSASSSDDPLLEEEIRKQMRNNEIKRKIYLVILGIVAFGCIGYLIFYFFMYAKNGAEYDELSQLVDNSKPKKEYSINLIENDDSIPPVLAKYETLFQKNNKIVGWLKVDGTKIDYPVMQTVNNEYYLDHNYNQEYDKNGSIFLDKDCNPAHPNDNMIIYGHHMKSGRMFGNLNYYSSEQFYKEHPTILFDTIYEEGVYDVMYVFRSKIYSEEEIVFKYYKFIDATSENEFDSNMNEMAQMSLYDTGVKAKYGDKLITLSTCDSSESNGRFVVVAKKVK